MLGLKFAYATNGHEIIEFDYFTGLEKPRRRLSRPRPSSGQRYRAGASISTTSSRRPPAHALQPRRRQGRALLPGDRHQPRRRGDPQRPAPPPAHHGHRHRQDRRRLPDLLEALERPLEPHRRAPPAPHPLPRRPQHPGGPPQGRHLRRLRRRPLQDRGRRGGQEPRDVLRHLPGPRRGRAPRRASTSEFPPDFFDLIIVDECHRGSARDDSQLARDPRVLRARLPARHDRHAAARRQPRHLPLLRQPALHVQPAAGHRRRLPRPLPRPPRRSPSGTPPAGGRARTSWTATAARSPTTSTRPRTSSASSPCAPAPQAIARHLTDFLKKTDRFAKTIVFCVDQEHAERDAPGPQQPERRPRRSSIPTTSAASPPTRATSAAAT